MSVTHRYINLDILSEEYNSLSQYLLVVCVIHIKVQNDLCWKYYYFRGCELREIISNFTTFSLFPVLNVCAIGKQWRVGGRRLMEVA